MGGLRGLVPPFVVPGPVGVTIRSRLRVSSAEATVLTSVGGSLASKDLAVRSREGVGHDASSWAARKRELSGLSSARWAGSITKATHDQWALVQKPLTTKIRKTTRHDAAAVAIGRRALGHSIRRRTAPPRTHQSDGYGYRTVQAGPDTPEREGPRPRLPGPRTRFVPSGRGVKAGDQRAQHRSGHAAGHASWEQDVLPLGLQE
ncbi:hypothetical protein [Streptomyces longisporus]